MKSLKLCFESLLDDEDVFYDPKNDRKEIENWIRSNYRVTGRLSILKDYTVNCTGNVYANNRSNITSLTNGLFKWGKIARNFSCATCDDLKSLEGGPKKVGGDFCCSNCGSLTSLEDAPKEVGRDFNCGGCEKLKSLEGAPEKVGGGLYCFGCKNIRITHSDRKKYKIVQ